MRTISASLTTAIGATTRRPAITLTAEDHVMHLHNSVATAVNNDGWSDMCVADDGSIIRVRVTYGGGGADFIQNFQYQRITDPTNASQWTTWTTFASGAGNMWDNGSCAVSNNPGGELRAFAQRGTGGAEIWNWWSFDNGVTWAGPATILTPPLSALIKGIGSAGHDDVFFLYDIVGGVAVGASFWNGHVWSAIVSASGILPTITDGHGLAVVWDSSTAKYTICYAHLYAIYSATYTPGTGAWAVVGTLAPWDTYAIGRKSPRLSLIDGVYHLVYIEADDGSYTGTVYNYPRVRRSVDLVHWSSGFILHDMPTSFNCNLVKTQTPSATRQQHIAATAKLVEYSNAYAQSDTTQYVDLSPYVLEYHRDEEFGAAAKITVTLDNMSGALNNYVSSYGVTYKPIGLHTSLVLYEGYYTGTPPTTKEVEKVATYTIKQIAFHRAPGRSTIKITAEDKTHYLDHEARYQISYVNITIGNMLKNVAVLTGVLSVSIPAVAQMSSMTPYFVLNAGQRYRLALDELSRIGWVEYFLDQDEVLQVVQLNASDPSVWTYQPEIETLVLGSEEDCSNHIIVSGKPPAGPGVAMGSVLNAEVYDDTHMHVTGIERLYMHTDPKLYTSTLVSYKASFLLAQEQREQIDHSITVPVNPALQLNDVITVTDQGASVSGTGQTVNARIWRQEITFDAEKGHYEQTIYLEGV